MLRGDYLRFGVVLKLLPVMDTLDIALRLCAATLVGIVLGLNRDLHGKPTGVRTLGILCLGSAVAVLSIHAVTGTDASRVIQGIVTGVGSGRGRDCPKRERPSRARAHNSRLRLGDSVCWPTQSADQPPDTTR